MADITWNNPTGAEPAKKQAFPGQYFGSEKERQQYTPYQKPKTFDYQAAIKAGKTDEQINAFVDEQNALGNTMVIDKGIVGRTKEAATKFMEGRDAIVQKRFGNIRQKAKDISEQQLYKTGSMPGWLQDIIGGIEYGTYAAGQAAAGIGEAIGSMAEVPLKGVIPEAEQEKIKATIGGAMQTPLPQAAMKGYEQAKTAYPEATQVIESTANVASLVPGPSAAKAGVKVASEAGEQALKTGGKVVGGAKKIVPATKEVVASRIAAKNIEKLDSNIDEALTKAIRPSVVGKKSARDIAVYKEKGRDAVKTIVENKGALAFSDDAGQIVGQLPENLNQFAEAIEQTKKKIFQQYDEMAQEAGEKVPAIQLNDIATELESITNNKVLQDLRPDVLEYAAKRAEALKSRGGYTPTEAQEAIQTMNQSLQAFYRNPSYDTASRAAIDALIANRMRKSLDDAIEQSVAPGYQELKNKYGSLKTIEKDVVNRAIVDARKNVKGLIDFTDVFSAGDVINGVLTMNPALILKGGAQKAIAQIWKLKNDPNRIIKGMFNKVDKTLEAKKTRGVPSK